MNTPWRLALLALAFLLVLAVWQPGLFELAALVLYAGLVAVIRDVDRETVQRARTPVPVPARRGERRFRRR